MNKSNLSGFTVVELMIVIAIVGILAAISMSFYGNYITDANRTDGRMALTETATSLEKCKSMYSAYNNANCNVAFPVISDDGLYSVATTAISPSAFSLTATPVAGGYQAGDTDCLTLTLTSTGIESGTGANITKCW